VTPARRKAAQGLLDRVRVEGERGLLGDQGLVDWLSARWRPHYGKTQPVTPSTIGTLRKAGLPVVPGKDQRRLPWTHTYLLASFIAVHGLVEPPPAWRTLMRSRWSAPDILEPALLALLRAALPARPRTPLLLVWIYWWAEMRR
jgi:hypothetical protein